MSRNLWAELRLQIAAEIAKATGHGPEHIEKLLEAPGKEGFGDFAFPCFGLAKSMKRSPVEIAEDVAYRAKVPFADVKAVGPYANFFLKWSEIAGQLLAEVGKEYGRAETRNNAVVEFSSPNPAHPFHMGTVRSTIMGEAVSKLLESQGWKVARLCYVNDLGKQAATLLTGYLKYAKGKKPVGKPDVWLGDIYFKINKEAEESKSLQEEVEAVIKKCEKREKGFYDVGQRVFRLCLKGFGENWKTLGVKFDEFVWESRFVDRSRKMVEDLKKKGLVFESEGALVLNLEPHGLPSTIILRSDGTGLYLTRELAFAIERVEKYKPELNLYITAEDQKLHFRQLFKTLELLDHKDTAAASKHLFYSIVLLEGRKMSARRGHVVLWDELLEEGIEKATKAIKKRWPELPAEEIGKRAKQIALAAIVYYILKYDPEKPVNFAWETALAFEGDTGPYLQYTHTRCAAILRKAKVKVSIGKFDGSLLKEEKEKRLLALLAQYPNVLARSAKDLHPHYVANYLFTLADNFSSFYEACPVLQAEHGLRQARLKLVEAVKTVLASGLGLLGIAAPERM